MNHGRVHERPHVVCPAPACGFIAATSNALVAHTRRLGHGAILACPFDNCDKNFTNGQAMKRHIKGPAHSGAGGEAVCKACGTCFAKVADYSAHVRRRCVSRQVKERARNLSTASGPISI